MDRKSLMREIPQLKKKIICVVPSLQWYTSISRFIQHVSWVGLFFSPRHRPDEGLILLWFRVSLVAIKSQQSK